jgi:hypothetical protein
MTDVLRPSTSSTAAITPHAATASAQAPTAAVVVAGRGDSMVTSPSMIELEHVNSPTSVTSVNAALLATSSLTSLSPTNNNTNTNTNSSNGVNGSINKSGVMSPPRALVRTGITTRRCAHTHIQPPSKMV